MNLRSLVPWFGLVVAPLAGCHAEVRERPARAEVVVSTAPPVERVEAVPASPGPNYIWIRGNWHWNGEYVWVAGHYDTVRPGYEYVHGHWDRRGNQWFWVDGYWRRR